MTPTQAQLVCVLGHRASLGVGDQRRGGIKRQDMFWRVRPGIHKLHRHLVCIPFERKQPLSVFILFPRLGAF